MVKKHKLLLFFSLMVYKIVIEVVYIRGVEPVFGYTQLYYIPNFNYLIFSYISLLVLVAFYPSNRSEPSYYLFTLLVLFIFIPTSSYFWLTSQSIEYYMLVLTGFIIISSIIKIKKVGINSKNTSISKILDSGFYVYILIILYLISIRGGVDTRALQLDTIYELRSEASVGGIAGYFLNWTAKVFTPFYAIYFFHYKKYTKLSLVLFSQLLLFLSYGFKAYLLSILLLLILLLLANKKTFESLFIMGYSAVIIFSLFLSNAQISNSLLNIIPFRLIFVPTQIQFQYYDFFQSQNFLSFSNNLIGKIFGVESLFERPISFIIAMEYQGVVSNSNTGFLADAYANGGGILLLFFSLIVGLILAVIDSVTKKLPVSIVVAAMGYLVFVMNDNALLTTLLSGGLILMIFLLYLFNSSIELNDRFDEKIGANRVE